MVLSRFLLQMVQDVEIHGAAPQVAADLRTVLSFVGADTVDSMTTEQHELFADTFLQYLRDRDFAGAQMVLAA